MFDRFDVWTFSDNHNCWDFVREYLIEKAGVPPEDVPKFGILPTDKRSMTKAYRGVKCKFVECGAQQNAIACQYHGGLLQHVGVVDGDFVRHTGKTKGTTKQKISDFEKDKTVYYKYVNA
jgi:hypothetical protein